MSGGLEALRNIEQQREEGMVAADGRSSCLA